MIDEINLAKQLIESTPKGVADTANDVWGLILGDKIAFYRRKNAMKLSKLLHDEAQRLGGKLDPGRIPDQFAFEWTESATKKSDETIQGMFARLLSSAAVEGGSCDERLIYVLREMSGEDAKLFSMLYADRSFRSMWRDRGFQIGSLVRTATDSLKINGEIAIDSLVRLGLISILTGVVNDNRHARWSSLSGNSQPEINISTQRLLRPSALGCLLYEQVSRLDNEEES